jgi:Raf kinase inhibitor-like YbhB/YbcL family protein
VKTFRRIPAALLNSARAGGSTRRIALTVVAVASLVACQRSAPPPEPSAAGTLAVTSPDFGDAGPIPSEYTCDGRDRPPRLEWEPAEGAGSTVLAMVDIDAPGGGFVHWLVYGIPGTDTELGGGGAGGTEGVNSFGDVGYGGPCPPQGDQPHRYVFTIYAVEEGFDTYPDEGATAEEVLGAIEDAVIAKGSITGTYRR